MNCFVCETLKEQEVWMKSNEMDFIDALMNKRRKQRWIVERTV
jgi:hypothetical protein